MQTEVKTTDLARTKREAKKAGMKVLEVWKTVNGFGCGRRKQTYRVVLVKA